MKTIPEQVDAALEEARDRAIAIRIGFNLGKFDFVVDRAERNAGEEGWTTHLSAEVAGKPVGGVKLRVVVPEPLAFDRLYRWDLLRVYPWWAEYRRESRVVRICSSR